jgi:hypothetical protein
MYQADSVYKAPNGSFWPRAADFGSGAGQQLLGYTGRAANAAAMAALDPSQPLASPRATPSILRGSMGEDPVPAPVDRGDDLVFRL